MRSSVNVFLDWPEGCDRCMYVVVLRNTTVVYEHEFGGESARRKKTEGFLVPVYSAEAAKRLDAVFVEEMDNAGVGEDAGFWTQGRVLTVASAVSQIDYWGAADRATSLELDTADLTQLDQGWLPVRTPDGPGVLVWPNPS